MKILLVRPTVFSRFAVSPPLSLGYLSASLKNAGYNDIHLLDGSLLQCHPQEAARLAAEIMPDIVGIQVYTGSEIWTKDFIREVKSKAPNILSVVGGPHITALESLALEFVMPDFGILGEGEQSIVEFVNYIKDKPASDISEVSGLMYYADGQWKHAKKPFGFLSNANDVPFPDWGLLHPENYFDLLESATMPLKGKKPSVILTSRGCPYKCTFCSSGVTNSRRMRYREARNIVDEIKLLKSEYGVDEIFFIDDNLTMNLRRAEEVFDLMIKENINIPWRAPNGLRVDRLSEQLVEKMAKSGCYYVGLGVESGNEEVLSSIKKSIDLETVTKAVDLLHKYNIQSSGFFICGLIGETKEQIIDTINYALKVRFDRIQMGIYTPYPGSEDFNKIYKTINITNSDNNSQLDRQLVFKFQDSGYIPKFREMSDTELVALQRQLTFKFYLRPRILWSLIRGLKLSQVKAILNHPYIKNWTGNKSELFTK